MGFRAGRLAILVLALTAGGAWWQLQPAPAENKALAAAAPRVPDLAEGDVVLLRGRSWRSQAVLASRSGSHYSHAGLIAVIDGRIGVIHAAPDGEGGDEGPGPARSPGAGVRLEPLEDLRRSMDAPHVAIYRSADVHQAAQAAAIARRWIGVPFNERFDLADSERLYCTQLIWLAYRQAGVDLVDGRFDRLNLPLPLPTRVSHVILPDSLAASRHLRLVGVFGESGHPVTIPSPEGDSAAPHERNRP